MSAGRLTLLLSKAEPHTSIRALVQAASSIEATSVLQSLTDTRVPGASACLLQDKRSFSTRAPVAQPAAQLTVRTSSAQAGAGHRLRALAQAQRCFAAPAAGSPSDFTGDNARQQSGSGQATEELKHSLLEQALQYVVRNRSVCLLAPRVCKQSCHKMAQHHARCLGAGCLMHAGNYVAMQDTSWYI